MTGVPESGYGAQLRAAADEIDRLVHRERKCDAHCGGEQGEIESQAAEIKRLRAALARIAAVQYGLDPSDATQDHEKYWSDLALSYRKRAADALKDAGT